MAKNFTNAQVAELLRRVSASYEVLGENRFRISAYDRAAVSIEHSSSEVKDVWDEGKLEQIPGIGKSIAGHLDELFKKGEVKHFKQLFKKLPPSMFVFLEIPGIGAKTAFTLAKKLKIKEEKNAIEKLKNAAKAGLISKIENFGEKSEDKILQGIASFEKGETKSNRMLLSYADQLANEIIIYLKQNSKVIEANPLGSLRRMVSTIGDIDISVSTDFPQEVMEYFLKFPKINTVLGKGEKDMARVILFSGQQVDIRFSKPESYGSMLQYFTGSKMHNISLREFALKNGFSLSEYGIKHQSPSTNHQAPRILHFDTEEKFYNFLGLDWIPPELREDAGEIEASLQHKLPQLVELTDIRGDLHIHSDFSIEPSHDLGESGLDELVQSAIELNYEYIGLSEHNPSNSKHSNIEINDLIKSRNDYIEQFILDYEKRGIKLPIKILKGLEIDIKPNGDLSVSDELLNLLDYAIVSVHTSFELNKKDMTKRVISALSHPKAKILGHPTGRLLNRREGYEIEWEELFDFCLKNKKFLEISSWPERLDLPDLMVKEAIKSGIKLCIDSDSHAFDQMVLMKYGVSVARRGWAEKKDIVNTLSKEQISDILN